MESNTTNANRYFHDFTNCDFRKHWSFSTLFKNVFTCEQLLDCNYIIEFGAANSCIEQILNRNYDHYPKYIRYDISKYDDCIVCDMTCDLPVHKIIRANAIVMLEVIEHLPLSLVNGVIERLVKYMPLTCKLVLSTPTPLKYAGMELVWPDSHEHEFSYIELMELLSPYFYVEKCMSWHCKDVRDHEHGDILMKAIKSTQVSPAYDATQIILSLRKK